MTGPRLRAQEAPWRSEVLRQAAVVLQGRAVGLWEVTGDGHLIMVDESGPRSLTPEAAGEVEDALRRWPQGLSAGRAWVGCRLDDRGRWCVAPVRTKAPSPPPRGVEWRSYERLVLELTGLCLGLGDEVSAGGAAGAGQPDSIRRFAEELGALTEQAVAPLGAPRVALARARAALGESDRPDRSIRNTVLMELDAADGALAAVASLAERLRARGPLVPTHPGEFDLVPVLQSAVAAERPGATHRAVKIEVGALGDPVPVLGDAAAVEEVLRLLVHSMVDALAGPGTLLLTLERVGPVIRLTFRIPARMAGSAFDSAREIVEVGFGGELAVGSYPGEGTVVTVRLAVSQPGLSGPGGQRNA